MSPYKFFFFLSLWASFSIAANFTTLSEISKEASAIVVVKGSQPLFTFEKVPVGTEKEPYKKRILNVIVKEVLRKKEGISIEKNARLALPSRFWQYELAETLHKNEFKEEFHLAKLSYPGVSIEKLKNPEFILFVFERLSPLNLTNETANQLYYLEGGFEKLEKKSEILKNLN